MMSETSEPFNPLRLDRMGGTAGRAAIRSLFGSRPRPSEIARAGDIAPARSKALPRHRSTGARGTAGQNFPERESRSVCIDDITNDWAVFAADLQRAESKQHLRRCVDVICSCLVALAVAPVLLLAALAIRLEDGGSVFYRQERIGLGGRPFMVLKFRSMRQDAEFDGVPLYAAEHDPRVTRVGRIIRLLRIDELPQLLNVLRGEMSLIGPRPERPYFVDTYSRLIPSYEYRHAVRPGITGWAQVSFRYGSSAEDAKRKLSYDLYYLKNRSMFLDLVIVLKTLGVVLRGWGAR